jgi:hypothetical protein
VDSRTELWSLRTRDTVATETPASRATCLMVTPTVTLHYVNVYIFRDLQPMSDLINAPGNVYMQISIGSS